MVFIHRYYSLIPAALMGILLLSPAIALAGEHGCGDQWRTPDDLSFHISLKNGQTSFHQGEIITLTAEYLATGQQRYLVNTRSYDRSGRLDGFEIYCMDPKNGTDPLEDYYQSQPDFAGGGLYSEPDLNGKPFDVELELNEWRSLPPGDYRLSIIGTRVRLAPSEGGQPPDDGIPLHSNTVEFTVEKAEVEWQAEEMGLATRILDSPSASKEEKRHSARILRFLGSEAAARELARRYWSERQDTGWELVLGLWSSPYKSAAIETMRAGIADPYHPVTRYYVDTLVSLEMQSDPRLRLPQFGTMSTHDYDSAMDANWKERQRRANNYMSQASSALNAKRGMAAALTASELLQAKTDDSVEGRTRLRHALIAGWETLPVQERNRIIADEWHQVKGPEWLPLLENIAVGRSAPDSGEADPDQTTALRRMLELSPDRGRTVAIAEMMAPSGGIQIEALDLLPDKELPQIEEPLLARMEKGEDDTLDYELLDRFASVGALARVKRLFEPQRDTWDCTAQAAMLRYFLRTDPIYGVAQVAHAVQKHATGCYNTPLNRLKEYLRMPEVERIAVAALDSSWTIAAGDAAESLMNYGSPATEKALFSRLRKLHLKWKNQPEKLAHAPAGALADDDERGLEKVLVKAIGSAQAWFGDASTLNRLKKLSSQAMRRDLDEKLEDLQVNEYHGIVSWIPDGKLRFNIAWYNGEGMANLKDKLAQFSRGNQVELIASDGESHAAECHEMMDAAATDGILLGLICK